MKIIEEIFCNNGCNNAEICGFRKFTNMNLQPNLPIQEQQSMGYALADTKSYSEVHSSQFWWKNQDIYQLVIGNKKNDFYSDAVSRSGWTVANIWRVWQCAQTYWIFPGILNYLPELQLGVNQSAMRCCITDNNWQVVREFITPSLILRCLTIFYAYYLMAH